MFKWFRRNKDENKEAKVAIAHGILAGSSQNPMDEQRLMEELNINIHMIEDKPLNDFLSDIATIKDDKGNVTEYDLNVVALRVLASKLIRTSYVDPIDVDIAQLEVDRLINRVEMNMDEETYEYGGTNLLEAMGKIIQTAWSDAKIGRKAKLLKVSPRVYEITIPEVEKRKRGIMT